MANTGKTVVVVDEEREVCDLFRMILETRDYRCLTAHDGLEGLELIRSTRPDAAILDIMLPSINGFEIFVELRKNPDYNQMPIMMISGVTENPQFDFHWKGRLEVDAFLTKPLDPDLLLKRLGEVLDDASI